MHFASGPRTTAIAPAITENEVSLAGFCVEIRHQVRAVFLKSSEDLGVSFGRRFRWEIAIDSDYHAVNTEPKIVYNDLHCNLLTP